MTSNLGADILLADCDRQRRTLSNEGLCEEHPAARRMVPSVHVSDEAKKQVMQVIREHFRPEFINRLDEIIMFNPLGYDQMKKVMRLQIDELNQRLKEQSIAVEADDSALEKIMESAYDPLYGARPLKRYIEQTIVTDLSKRLIAGTIVPGNVYKLAAENGVFTYTRIRPFNM